MRSILAGLAVVCLVGAAGCTPSQYRRQADKDVYGLLQAGTRNQRWQLTRYTIQPNCRSRLYDPYHPDKEPMPPDDPTANQLMHCVDGRHGARGWGRDGYTSTVENPEWKKYLPVDEKGAVLLDRDTAVKLALINSREYQQQLENLYLTALDVTYQRFRLDAQFFGGNSVFFTSDGKVRGGGESASTLDVENGIHGQQLLAGGGELMVGIANSLVWQFSGPDTYTANSVIDFSLVQPLLRGAGRAVVLEALTESERNLLNNIRQMDRYRHGFYVSIVAGRNPGIGPVRGGILLNSGVSPIGQTGGFLAILQEEVQIRNQRANLAGLQDSVDLFEALFRASKLPNRFQVDLSRQSYLNAQSRLLSLRTAHEDRLDAFKISMGLPPDLPIRVRDDLLAPFDLIDPDVTATQEAVGDLIHKIREAQHPLTAEDLEKLDRIIRETRSHEKEIRNDMQALDKALPRRRENLKSIANRPELRDGSADPSIASVEALDRRAEGVRRDYADVVQDLDETMGMLEKVRKEIPALVAKSTPEQREDLKRKLDEQLLTPLSGQLLRLSLVQAGARLDTVTLIPIDLAPEKALEIARNNRLDWMNARTTLVDNWRRIRVVANALEAGLNVTFSGDLGTVNNRPLAFNADNGRLRVGLQFDPPLTRLAERNAYREALIDYQQARRDYMAFEDRISQILRTELRGIELAQLNFELRRAAMFVSISQVDLARLNLDRPLKPGETTPVSVTAARDLVNALSGLLDAQNAFLGLWVDYQVSRMNLDFDLGTMKLDPCGLWIDPGAIDNKTADGQPAPPDGGPEEIPPGIPEAPMPK